MRTLLPALLTLPSHTVDTVSCLPILRISSVLPLNMKEDVRAGTRNPLIWDKAVHRSSVIPSPRYSFSLSVLMLTKGNTAMLGFVSISCDLLLFQNNGRVTAR